MNAIQNRDNPQRTFGFARFGEFERRTGTVRQIVHDGDTVHVRLDGNLGVRLLGIDTPEVSFSLPGQGFVPLSVDRWDRFLRNPFAAEWPEFEPALSTGLKRSIQDRLDDGLARNHLDHARAAEDSLESLIQRDLRDLDQDAETFRFFMSFAYEVMDGYGRLLGFINRSQADPRRPEPRPKSYNERLLALGRALPYFIWPNVNPFRRADSIFQAVFEPGSARTTAEADETLQSARQSVRDARRQHRGLFDAMNPLVIESFELRWLAQRRPPHRWVIDLTQNDDVLIPPQEYHTIAHPEDRLFVSPEFVPLFVERGWKRG